MNQGKVLLLKRHPKEKDAAGRWEIPSGKVRFGEGPQEAVVREIREETGLDAKPEGPFYATHYMTKSRKMERHTIEISYIINLRERRTIKLSPREHTDYAWVTPNELGEYPLAPSTQGVVRESLRVYQSSFNVE